MNDVPIESGPSPPALDKEAYTGIAGRHCRYRGDADRGIQVELSPGDILTVTSAQITQIFADLSAFNLLLEDTLGVNRAPDPVESIKVAARARLEGRANRSKPKVRVDPFRHLVCPRFAAWLEAHDVALWNRRINAQGAAYIQAAFSGEGLLPFEMDRPGGFPVADLLTALHALVGHRVVYEESRRFALVELLSVTVGSDNSDHVFLTFSNLDAPGFSPEFPPTFRAGGSLDATTVNYGAVSGYMGIWQLITSPKAVARICEQAPGLNRQDLLKLCRQVEHGGPTAKAV
jgi:hypothetical protein